RGLIAAIENFASSSGMLAEQIWDRPDIPEAHMHLGKPCGAAMPLMWAHAEYIKLLRSVRDNRVFDLIPPVADRYLAGKGRKDLELWKSKRQVRMIAAGSTLRVVLAGGFRLRLSRDGGQSSQEMASTTSGIRVSYGDIATHHGQNGVVQFTFVETGVQEFRGKMFEVKVSNQHSAISTQFART